MLRTALYQMHIIWRDEEANFQQIRRQLARAEKENVDLFLMPETCFDGFFEGETLEDCQIVQTVLGWAEEFHMAIGFGWVRRDVRPVPPAARRMFENHYTITGKDGRVLSDYSKIHLFQGPRKGHAFRPGDRLTLFQINGIPATTFICYDLWFPECVSKMADRAHLVILPANWEECDYDYSHWKTLIRARAMENQQYLLAVNCVGQNGRFRYGGCSAAIGPDGDLLPVKAGDPDILMTDREGLLIYDIEDDTDACRSAFPVVPNRQPGLYPSLTISEK